MNAHPEADPGDARPRENDAPGGAAPEAARPGSDLREAIRREVVAVLVVLGRGRENAIRGRLLAGAVRERLADQGIEVHCSPASLQRIMREEIVKLIEAGEGIASSSSAPFGYYIPETAEEIAEGGAELKSRIVALSKRLKRYDGNTSDQLLAFLGQLGLEVAR